MEDETRPNKPYADFSQTVEENDFAIIFDGSGRVKGIWLPAWFTENDKMPDSIELIMGSFFGNASGQASRTLH